MKSIKPYIKVEEAVEMNYSIYRQLYVATYQYRIKGWVFARLLRESYIEFGKVIFPRRLNAHEKFEV